MDAAKLYQKYSMDELIRMEKDICNDPKNKQDGFYIYTPKARKKLDEIAWAITYHLRDNRRARGENINEAGYTGK
jgi:hypothetical protein